MVRASSFPPRVSPEGETLKLIYITGKQSEGGEEAKHIYLCERENETGRL